jgi:hypothetical protein
MSATGVSQLLSAPSGSAKVIYGSALANDTLLTTSPGTLLFQFNTSNDNSYLSPGTYTIDLDYNTAVKGIVSAAPTTPTQLNDGAYAIQYRLEIYRKSDDALLVIINFMYDGYKPMPWATTPGKTINVAGTSSTTFQITRSDVYYQIRGYYTPGASALWTTSTGTALAAGTAVSIIRHTT